MLARNATRKLLASSKGLYALPAAARCMSEGVKKTLIYDEHVKMGGNMASSTASPRRHMLGGEL